MMRNVEENMRSEFDMATDDRLLELFRVAEARRRWNRMAESVKRINWYAVLGLLLIVITASAFWIQVARTF